MAEPPLKEKIEQIIADNPVLLMMKGSPEAPSCGNSQRAIQVLEAYGVEYAALDVLPALEPLREATGEIADWRTFPQLYVNGDLVGGADILVEMHEAGELAEVLGAEPSTSEPATGISASEAEEMPADVQQSPPMQIENS